MNTEITVNTGNECKGWIFYDAACSLCVGGRRRTGRLFESRGYHWLPLQTPGSAARLGAPESAFDTRMHLLTAQGRVLHNADAFGALCRSVWWLWPLGALLLIPGFRGSGRLAYDWFARHRHRISRAFRPFHDRKKRRKLQDWMLAALPPLLVGTFGWPFAPWQFMWAMALALGFGLKWLAWRDALDHGARPSPRRALAWFAFWPGMDGRAFLSDQPAMRSQPYDWFSAVLAAAFGTVLIWFAVPLILVRNAMGAAWIGMMGISLVLHFGVIRALSIWCRSLGLNAEPIMNAPMRATSLAEFWGARWNTGFSIPAKRLILVPMTKRVGLPMAGLAVFLISGLVHELVISVPARAGFGLPTLYFALQGAGIALERSRLGRRCGLRRGARGRLFAICFVVGPVYWLFHPAFAQVVVIPFLKFLNHS